jgi:hypothetical protein
MKHYAPPLAELRLPAAIIIIFENSCQFNRFRISNSNFGNNYCLSSISLICFVEKVHRFRGSGFRGLGLRPHKTTPQAGFGASRFSAAAGLKKRPVYSKKKL